MFTREDYIEDSSKENFHKYYRQFVNDEILKAVPAGFHRKKLSAKDALARKIAPLVDSKLIKEAGDSGTLSFYVCIVGQASLINEEAEADKGPNEDFKSRKDQAIKNREAKLDAIKKREAKQLKEAQEKEKQEEEAKREAENLQKAKASKDKK